MVAILENIGLFFFSSIVTVNFSLISNELVSFFNLTGIGETDV